MEQPQNIKTISIVVIVLLVLGAGYALSTKYRTSNQGDSSVSPANDDRPATVVVENTPMVNGTIPAPAGFPQDIPLEKGEILESAITQYPEQNAKQLSLSYQSAKTIAQKYAEYKSYMQQAGYQITEGDASSPVRAIFGTKESANLSVAISSLKKQTLVQLSYLLKSI